MFMGEESTAYGRLRQPHSVGIFNYRIRMNPKDSKKVLWDNVSRLMVARYGKENLTRLSQEAKVGPATCTRIKKQTTSVGTDVIEAIAKALKVSTWQLLVAGLDPKALPELAQTISPVAQETPAAYTGVTAAEAIRVLSQALLTMEPASRERAAKLLSSMALDPEWQWTKLLIDLLEREVVPTIHGTGKPDRESEEGIHPSNLSIQQPTIKKKVNDVSGNALTKSIRAGDDFNKPPGAPESGTGDDH